MMDGGNQEGTLESVSLLGIPTMSTKLANGRRSSQTLFRPRMSRRNVQPAVQMSLRGEGLSARCISAGGRRVVGFLTHIMG